MCPRRQRLLDPEGEGTTLLRNIGNQLPKHGFPGHTFIICESLFRFLENGLLSFRSVILADFESYVKWGPLCCDAPVEVSDV
jgi:hypothetical protein